MPPRRPQKPPADELPTKEDLKRGFQVHFEQVAGHIKVALENFATKADFRELKADTREINVRFDSVDSQLRSMRDEFVRKADAATLAALDQRVTILERRAG